MDYKEMIKYLKSYKDLYYRLEYINNRIEGIKAVGYKNDNNGPVKTVNDYLDEKYQINDKMSEIEDLVAKIENYKLMTIIKYKFLEFKTLEEVSGIMNYSYSQVYRYYKKGIKKLLLII